MDNYKQNQEILRRSLIAGVERYLGYAEDINDDKIFINEKSYHVEYRSRHDDRRPADSESYSVMKFITRDGLWFKPDLDAIEAAVQEHLPSPNIESKFKEWCEVIKTFLIAEQPTSLHSCRFAIGTESVSMDCYDEAKEPIGEGAEHTYEEEMEYEWESVDVEPMRKAVTKTATGYTISIYNLTKLILNYIKPE